MDKSFVEIIKDARKQAWKARLADKVSHLELIPANVAGWNNKLIFYKNTGKVIYIKTSNEMYDAKFNKNTNTFRLLDFLTQNPKRLFSHEVLGLKLKNHRSGAGDGVASSFQRVRDTVQEIREKLKLPKGEDIFLVDYGFGLKCDVEIKT